jgi:hypothetical protein
LFEGRGVLILCRLFYIRLRRFSLYAAGAGMRAPPDPQEAIWVMEHKEKSGFSNFQNPSWRRLP